MQVIGDSGNCDTGRDRCIREDLTIQRNSGLTFVEDLEKGECMIETCGCVYATGRAVVLPQWTERDLLQEYFDTISVDLRNMILSINVSSTTHGNDR